MNLNEVVQAYPHLASPAHLALADTDGKFQVRAHVAVMNRELVRAAMTPNSRLAMNMPPQHGKSWISSKYFPAWLLLLFPWLRIILCSYQEGYSATFGSAVKDLVEKFGRDLGVSLREDTKAKNEWVIEKHGGGMVCKGLRGAITGRPCDLLLLDDTIKDDSEALSLDLLDKKWSWYTTVAYSRLGPTAPIINVGTRWASQDIFGRQAREAQRTGELWKVVKFKALAEENDLLGRKPGAALWPERVPRERLELIRAERGHWFNICWQQEPETEQGAHFRPRGWPRFTDIGDQYSLDEGFRRTLYPHRDVTRFVAIDWAGSKKGQAKGGTNFNCFGAWALTPDGRCLLLAVFNQRLRAEHSAPALEKFCQQWQPAWCVADDDMLAIAKRNECRQLHIPEIHLLPIGAQPKLARAQAAIIMGAQDRFLLPAEPRPWLEPYCTQLTGFTGMEDDQDDMADMTGIAGRKCQQLRPATHAAPDHGAICLIGGKGDVYV